MESGINWLAAPHLRLEYKKSGGVFCYFIDWYPEGLDACLVQKIKETVPDCLWYSNQPRKELFGKLKSLYSDESKQVSVQLTQVTESVKYCQKNPFYGLEDLCLEVFLEHIRKEKKLIIRIYVGFPESTSND